MKQQRIPWIEGQRMLRIRGKDVAVFLLLIVLAAGSIASGALASRQVTPGSARAISSMLERLEPAARLPNVVLKDEEGRWSPLLARTKRQEAVVIFYGTFCEKCQDAVPRMARVFGSDGPLLVVVDAQEPREEVRRRLDDLGLRDLPFVIDELGTLEQQAKVYELPTIFRIGPEGEVLERLEGIDETIFERLLRRFGSGSRGRVTNRTRSIGGR